MSEDKPADSEQPSPTENPSISFSVRDQASGYLEGKRGPDEEVWKDRQTEARMKHLQELRQSYCRNLESTQRRMAKVGIADGGRITLENEEIEWREKITAIDQELHGIGYRADATEIMRFRMQSASFDGTRTDNWPTDKADEIFQGLAMREKFFAVTLSIFNGLKYPDFREVYQTVLNAMHASPDEDKTKPSTYFEISDEEILAKIGAEIKPCESEPEEIIIFSDESYPAMFFDLMRRRYRGVLFGLLPALRQIVEGHRYWLIRNRAALAVSEIGRIGFRETRSQVLDPWAGDARAYVRAAVGYPLARLAENEASRPAVQNLLGAWTNEAWSSSDDAWRYRWTAASTYKQIGLIDADWAQRWAYQGLKELAGVDDIRLADAVIHTLVVLSLQGHLERVLQNTKEWVEEGSRGTKTDPAYQVRCIVGILAFMELSEVHVELTREDKNEAGKLGVQVGNLFELVCQGEAQRDDRWQLAIAVGIRSFERRLSSPFLDLMEQWAEYAGANTTLQNTVCNLLAEIYGQIKWLPAYEQHFRNRINQWREPKKDEQLHRIAALTLARLR